MEQDNEIENLSRLENELKHYVEVVNELIQVTSDNINKLNVYINYRYNEIEKLIRKKRTRIAKHNCDERNRMTLFYDNTYGNVPSNEDAIKVDEYMSSFSNIRKKYDYKEKVWNKRMLQHLFEIVETTAKRYAKEYLLNPTMGKDAMLMKKKQLDKMNANQLLSELKTLFETQNTFQMNSAIPAKPFEESSELENIKKWNLASSLPDFSVFMQKFWAEVADKLNIKCSMKDCQTAWIHYGCFGEDNNKWEEEEVNKLLMLCKKHNYKNWVATARELNTNRSPACCFEKYIKVSKLYKKEDIIKTERVGYKVLEDIQLQLLVSILGDDNWVEVKNCMHYLNPHIKRVGKTEEELDVLLNGQGKQTGDWTTYKRRYYRLMNTQKKERKIN